MTIVRLLPRPGLINGLADMVARHRLTIVAAPMGYGKTITAKALAGTLGRRAEYRDLSHGPDTVDRCLECIREEFPHGAAGNADTLIVDNYHVGPDALDHGMTDFLRASPSGMHIALFSRIRPRLGLDDSIASGLIAWSDHELLRFTLSDTREYFAMHGIDDDEAAQTAWERGEGWPVAIWLAARKRLHSSDCQDEPDLSTLLEKLVFADVPPLERDFLRRMSVLDSFSEEDAEKLTGRDGVRVLRHFVERGDLIQNDIVAGRYRLHGMVRDYLVQELRADVSINSAALYSAAAECCLDRSDLPGAFRFRMRSGRLEDGARALGLFLMEGAEELMPLLTEEFIPAIQSLPWEVRCRDPLGYLAFIRFLILAGEKPGVVVNLLEEAKAHFLHGGDVSSEMAHHVEGEMEILSGLACFSDMKKKCAHYAAALELLMGPSRIHPGQLWWTLGTPHLSLAYLQDAGRFRELVKSAAVVEKTLAILSDGYAVGGARLFAIEYHLERGDLAVARSLLDEWDRDAVSVSPKATIAAAFARARYSMAVGAVEEADAVLKQAKAQVRAFGSEGDRESLDLATAYICTTLGRLDAVPQWILDGMKHPPWHDLVKRRPFVLVVYGKTLLASGLFEQLAAVARNMPLRFGCHDSLLVRIHAKALEAIAMYHLGNIREAETLLRCAVDLSRPDNLVLLLAEYGEAIEPVLRSLKRNGPADSHMEAIHTLNNANRTAAAAKEKTVLTSREEEAMRLVVKGFSNVAIGRHMGISRETVVKHLASAYEKMGVSNRVQACRMFTLRESRKGTA